MSQYNIALLPENQTQKNNLQEIIEILDTIKLSATYQYPIWERLQTEHTSPNFYQQQELTLAKNTTCTLISPETEDPSGKGKYFIANQDQANIQLFCETFQLHTQMYSCRIFTEEHQTTPQDSHIRILSPLGSVGYGTLQIQDISPELRQILEKEHPDMAKFADQEIEDLIINIHIYNRKNSLKILEFAKNLQNPKFKRIILHESQQDNPYFLIEPNDPAWEIMNLQQLRHWLQENIIHQAIIIGTSSLVDWFTGIGLQIANHSYIGDAYALFTPTAMYWPQCPLEISNYLSLLFTARTMLEYLQEKDKSSLLNSAIMKAIQQPLHTQKKTRNTSIYPRNIKK